MRYWVVSNHGLISQVDCEKNIVIQSDDVSMESTEMKHALCDRISACCYVNGTLFSFYNAGKSSCIRRFDPTTNTMNHFEYLSFFPRGAVYDGNNVWCCAYRSNRSSGLVMRYTDKLSVCKEVLELPFNNPSGLAWDGVNFWTIDLNKNVLCKINIDDPAKSPN